MNSTKFAVKLTIKISILIIISIIASIFFHSPVISNELALTQMENSNELYLAVEAYNRVKPIISVIYGCITALLAGTTICDIYKFITKENKGENRI